MTVFCHHIYEYKKGLRSLILHTMPGSTRTYVENKLERRGIAYQIYTLRNGNINVFFGAEECVAVIRAIGKPCLNDYTPEEDFILGTMLGYDRLLQCRRYLDRTGHAERDMRNTVNSAEEANQAVQEPAGFRLVSEA